MNHLDKLFRNKLEHISADIPEGAWERVRLELPNQKNNIKLWWAFASVFLTAIFVYSGYLIFINDTSDTFNLKLASGKGSSHSQYEISLSPDSLAGILKYVPTNEKQEKRKLASYETQNIKSSYLTVDNTKSIFSKTPITSENIEHWEEIKNTNKYVSDKENEDISIINNLITAEKNKNTLALPIEMSSFAKDVPAKACPFGSEYRNKSVDVYFSHDIPVKILASDSPQFDSYMGMRKQTEKSIYSFSAGARFGFNVGYRWNLHTGINYSQINEKFEYIDPESNQTRIITIKDYVYSNGKIVDSIITEEQVIIPGTTKLKVFNKFKSFDIPVISRFTVFANRNLSLSAMAGVYLNISVNEKGMILGADNITPIDISSPPDSESEIFKSEWGISGFGAISMAYHLTSNLDFLLEPNARFQTESMTTETYPLQQRYNTFGLSTGLRFKF